MNTDFRNYKIIEFDTKQCGPLYDLIDSNRERLETYFAGTVKNTKTLEDTISYCKQIDMRVKNKSYYIYTITNKENNSLIGLIDVKNIDWNVPKAEIGYFIDFNHQGKGIITNAVAILIEYLLKEYNFKKLLCRINSENIGSIKVALNNGFKLEGTIRNDYRTTSNEIVDLNYYGRIF
ncbi:GNAT family N-acetyltransferase [Maribacter sp. HTCC2170]|uniref:GNAT family N-acetyltransferase n=1 Tax=Maribacter sp. (strain HTCC2170 / KCCM 42371) TaxID=313603 RepID=UPI00006B21AD|nr:GNAT family protein [Maribacter sp. HTCC2170]EAR00056.1 ribosomal-protein-serine N-acetyltransferase [Maribacter sp. HTCC2170]